MTAPKKTKKKKPEADAVVIERMARALYADDEAANVATPALARPWADICDDERDTYRQMAAVALAAIRGEKPVLVAETAPLVGEGQSAFIESCTLVTRLTATGHERVLILENESRHVLPASPSLDAHMASWLLSVASGTRPGTSASIGRPSKGLVRG